jgi:hypothetical protein
LVKRKILNSSSDEENINYKNQISKLIFEKKNLIFSGIEYVITQDQNECENSYLIIDDLGNDYYINQIAQASRIIKDKNAKFIFSISNHPPLCSEKLFAYIFFNLFLEKERFVSPLEAKFYRTDIIKEAFDKKIFENNVFSPLELQFYTNLKNKNIPALYHSIYPNDKLPQEVITKYIYEYLSDLPTIFQKYAKKDKWTESFNLLVNNLDINMFENLVCECPQEIFEKSFEELKQYKGVTAFELIALSCEQRSGVTKRTIKRKSKNPWTIEDCWYTSDDFDAKCLHFQRNESCPILCPPILSKQGLRFKPQSIQVQIDELRKKHSSILRNINANFNPANFSNEPSPPIFIGTISDKEKFSKWGPPPQAQNIPVKFPFTDYRLPNELLQFEEVLQKSANFWHSINPEYADYYYCYLSVAQSTVPPGCYQRRGHLHSDGFQSAWLKVPLFSDFSFIASDTSFTEFFLQSFDVSSLDPSKHNFYKYFKKNMKVKPLRLRKAYEILAMDSYTLHKARSNTSQHPVCRTFVRIMYSAIRWQSKTNTYNPMFNYTWPKRERNLLIHLK